MEEKEYVRPPDWKGWDLSCSFEKGCVEACYDEGDGSPLHVFEFTPRNALIFAENLVKKATSLLDAGKSFE